jgi:hypothetical protein
MFIGIGISLVGQGAAGISIPPSEAPANTVLPAISGTPTVGQTLSTTQGTWTNGPSSKAYQWYADDVAIVGATSSTYELTEEYHRCQRRGSKRRSWPGRWLAGYDGGCSRSGQRG